MTEERCIVRERAQKIVSEFTRLIEEGNGSCLNGADDAGPGKEQDGTDRHRLAVNRVIEYAVEGDRELVGDCYVMRFVFDAALAVAEKPWETPCDVYDRLPLYGFRKNEEVLQWAHWFGSHRKRTLSVNVFLRDIQNVSTRKSVNDLMFETFRAEQRSIASRVISFLKDDAHWK
jgi:hypothetical protein